MQINSVGYISGVGAASEGAVVSMEQRMGLASDRLVVDPSFDEFYKQFMAWAGEAVSSKDIREFIKSYVDEQGDFLYRTSQKQVDVLTSVLSRMKDSQMQEDALYKEVKTSLVSVASANMFISQFMQDVFKPVSEEDQEEANSW